MMVVVAAFVAHAPNGLTHIFFHNPVSVTGAMPNDTNSKTWTMFARAEAATTLTDSRPVARVRLLNNFFAYILFSRPRLLWKHVFRKSNVPFAQDMVLKNIW